MSNTDTGAAALANKRHVISLIMTAVSVCVAFAPAVAFVIFHTVFPFWLICTCLILARLIYLDGSKAWQLRQRAQKGAVGEAKVKALLESLPKGWSWECGPNIQGVGDIDFLLKAPDGRTIVVEVKSHEGEVGINAGGLYRRIGGLVKPFEKNFFSQMVRQGLAIKALHGLKWVTLVLVFTNAKIGFSERKQRGVYVLQSNELLRVLDLLACPDCKHSDNHWHEEPDLFLEDNGFAVFGYGNAMVLSQPKQP